MNKYEKAMQEIDKIENKYIKADIRKSIEFNAKLKKDTFKEEYNVELKLLCNEENVVIIRADNVVKIYNNYFGNEVLGPLVICVHEMEEAYMNLQQ